MSWKMIPETYQPDTADSRKESGLKYIKMYDEKYVQEMAQMIRDLSDSLQIAVGKSTSRGIQRCSIPLIQRAHKLLTDWKTR